MTLGSCAEPAQGSQERKYVKVSVISKKFGARSGEEDKRKQEYYVSLYHFTCGLSVQVQQTCQRKSSSTAKSASAQVITMKRKMRRVQMYDAHLKRHTFRQAQCTRYDV